MAGKGSLRYDHPLNLGAIGVTGDSGRQPHRPRRRPRHRHRDALQRLHHHEQDRVPESAVRFVNLNVAEFDAGKHHGLALTGDARVGLEELGRLLEG